MAQNEKTRKRKHPHPKDWGRRSRVLGALCERETSVSSLASQIGRSQGYVSAVIWGVDRHRTTEELIASVLGKSWDELFDPKTRADGRAA